MYIQKFLVLNMFQNLAYTKLDDESKDRLNELLCKAYDPENAKKRHRSVVWAGEKNPHVNDDDHRYYVIRDKNNIIAYTMRMPVEVFLKDKIVHAFFHHETLVHPEYRRKGLGIEVSRNVINDSNGLCMAPWANEKNTNLLTKIGWSEIGEIKAVKKILKIDNIIKAKVKSHRIRYVLTFVGNIYLKFGQGERFNLSNNVRIFEINKFKDGIRESLDHIIKKFKIIVYRDVDYLNWKYIDIPYREYKIYGVRLGSDFKGYVVLRVEKDIYKNLVKGIIVDLLCDPDEKDCFFSLVLKAEEYFFEEGCDFIVCLLTFDKFAEWMRKLKFFQKKLKRKSFFLLTNVDQINDTEFARDFRNWYITYGDSDYDMLTGTLKREAR